MKYHETLMPAFIRFAIEHKESGDIDPVYPVLYHVQRMRAMTREQAIWHTLLYLTWYHLGSAELVICVNRDAVLFPSLRALPTGVERRGFRGMGGAERAAEFLNWMIQNRKPFSQWLEEVTAPGGMAGWEALYRDVQTFPHCGSWAAFKWCDLSRNVLGCSITSPDIGLGGGGKCAGPVPGLSLLTGRPWGECAKSRALQEEFYNYCLRCEVPWEGWEEMETALCDFNSLVHGRYYVGHDIDKQMEDLSACPRVYWEARRFAFPRSYLGEVMGWSGVRNKLKGTLRGVKVEHNVPPSACPMEGGIA